MEFTTEMPLLDDKGVKDKRGDSACDIRHEQHLKVFTITEDHRYRPKLLGGSGQYRDIPRFDIGCPLSLFIQFDFLQNTNQCTPSY